MSNESSFLRTPRPQNDLVENAEVSQLRGLVCHSSPHIIHQLPPSTSNHDNVPQLNGYQPDAHYAGAHHGPNYADYGHWAQYRDNPYRDNRWYEGPPPTATVGRH